MRQRSVVETTASEKPVVLLVLTAIVLVIALYQIAFYISVSAAFPTMFDSVWISVKVAAYMYLAIGSALLLMRKRVGVYLVELAALFLIVFSCWHLSNIIYVSISGSTNITTIALLVGATTQVVWLGCQLFFLWCLRNDKAILYFDLNRNLPDA